MEITHELLKEIRTIALESYKEFWGNQKSDYITKEIENFPKKFTFHPGKVYIKIMSSSGIFGFIVNVHNHKKFKYGDLLYAGGPTPTVNFKRGSIFDLKNARIRWTGFF